MAGERLILLAPQQVGMPDGGVLLLDHATSGKGVWMSRLDGDGKVALEATEVTYDEYAKLRAKNADLGLPEMKPPAEGAQASGNTVGRVVGETPAADVPAAESNPEVSAETAGEASLGTKVLDGVQIGLDVVGLIPGAGEVADLANAGISALRGDFVGAGISLFAAIPFVGWLGTGAKAAKYADEAVEVAQAATKHADEVAGAGAKQADEAAETGAKQGDEAGETAANKAEDKNNAQVKKRDCKKFQKGPPGATHQGGRHGQVQKDSGALKRESHHIPPDSVTPKSISKVDGPAISMDYADHRGLSSTGRATTHPDSIAQATMANGGPAGFFSAMMMEIVEIRQKHGDKYDLAILAMLAYAACMGYIPALPLKL